MNPNLVQPRAALKETVSPTPSPTPSLLHRQAPFDELPDHGLEGGSLLSHPIEGRAEDPFSVFEPKAVAPAAASRPGVDRIALDVAAHLAVGLNGITDVSAGW